MDVKCSAMHEILPQNKELTYQKCLKYLPSNFKTHQHWPLGLGTGPDSPEARDPVEGESWKKTRVLLGRQHHQYLLWSASK